MSQPLDYAAILPNRAWKNVKSKWPGFTDFLSFFGLYRCENIQGVPKKWCIAILLGFPLKLFIKSSFSLASEHIAALSIKLTFRTADYGIWGILKAKVCSIRPQTLLYLKTWLERRLPLSRLIRVSKVLRCPTFWFEPGKGESKMSLNTFSQVITNLSKGGGFIENWRDLTSVMKLKLW